MTAPRREDWRRVREVFEAALAQPAVYRQPFVAEACRGEPGIYDQVIGLLASHDSAATFLETPAARLLDDGPWADLAGQRIGPYHLEARIGGGGMGEVFRARDTRLDRLVALKLIAWPAAPDAEVRRRFEREARAIAKLNHPNICVLYDVGQHKDADFLVMEYLQGETLAELLTRGPLAPELLRQCAVGIADALDFAHRHHIIHRDLKPSNIIVTESGAKLLDFGIAKLLHRDNEADTDAPVVADATLTQRGRIVGTVAYMSPEQVRGEAIDGRSDLFSFGAVLYEMATGRRRFPGAHTSAVSEAILTGAEDGADPTAVVSGPIGDIIRKALRAERTQRYQRAREIKADLLALEPEDRAHLREQRKPSWVSKAAAVLLAALVLVVSLWLAIDRRSPVATVTAPPSVAVLPFKPLVPGAPDDAYLGLGLAEALITELGTFRTIAVRPVTATSHYGPNRNPVAAGRELGTDLVLDGALQRSADRLRINVSLVRVADGLTVWADRFDVQWTDVFRVQDAIAEQVGRALPAALSGEDRERMVRRRTDNAAAYEAYLKGRYFWSMSFARDVSTPRLYRLNGTTPDDWVDVTQDVDQATHQICAIAHSPAQLGTFALFTPANEATRVTTLAGNGSGPQFPPGGGVVNGDGGPAVSAALREPSNVAFDLQHDVMYIADGFAVRAVKLSTGVITTYAGNGYQPPFGDIRENVLATDTGIFQVTSVAVDADGNLFLAEPSNCIVRRIDFATRIITTVAGHWTGDQASSCGYTGDGGAARNAQLAATGLIKFDATGDLFLVHLAAWPQGSNTGTVIRRIARSPGDGRIKGRDDEIISTIAGNGTPAAVQGAEPLSTGLYGGFAFGNHNDLYAFANFQLVRIFEGHTQIVAGLGFDPFRPPFAGDQLHPLQAAILGVGIVVLPSGDVLFSDLNAQKIRRISPGADGVVDGSPDERITTIAGFTFPLTALSQPNQLAAEGYALSTAFPLSGLTIDPRDGGVITSDIFLLRVRKFGPSLSTTNHPPIANAGVDQPGATNPVHLDGSASSDPDNDPLTFEWSEGTTALGTGAQLTVSLGAGSHTITLRVTDNHGASTTDTVVVSVGGGDLAITATASASQVHALDSLQYTVAALNLGSVAVDPVQLVVTLPQGMQFIGSSPASCSASGTTLTCALGSIAAGAKRTTIIDVRAALLGAFSTTFDVSSPAAESDPTNNSVTLSGSADLYLAESVGVADVSTMQRSLILPLISEDVIVADASAPRPSVMLPLISENIVVADTASIPDATAPLTVTLLAPVEGARLFTDVPTTIQWRVTGQPTSFDVELSTTAIDLFQPLSGCANLPASATSCVWMPPAPLRIARVRVVAHGEADPRTEPGELDAVRASLPTAQLALLPGAGHSPHSERSAAEAVTELIARFLTT